MYMDGKVISNTYWEGHEPFVDMWRTELLREFDWTQSEYFVTVSPILKNPKSNNN